MLYQSVFPAPMSSARSVFFALTKVRSFRKASAQAVLYVAMLSMIVAALKPITAFNSVGLALLELGAFAAVSALVMEDLVRGFKYARSSRARSQLPYLTSMAYYGDMMGAVLAEIEEICKRDPFSELLGRSLQDARAIVSDGLEACAAVDAGTWTGVYSPGFAAVHKLRNLRDTIDMVVPVS